MKSLHIISFDNPYPANYGGAIDMYYRIKELSKAGVTITLHLFCYGRNDLGDLEVLCAKVYIYERKLSWYKQFSIYPFIVITRKNKQLMNNLLENNAPILFEGLHTCYYLNNSLLRNRKKLVRMHNIEHHYYRELSRIEKNVTKKFYFYIESIRLHLYERKIKNADYVFAISSNDLLHFKKINKNSELMSGSHPFDKVESKIGRGEYILYHGNLGVAENINAVKFIVNEIASKLSYSFIIAGKNPTKDLIELVSLADNVSLISNPEEADLKELIQNAHINLLPTFQSTGLKLKLLYALYLGRFVIVTPEMVEGTGLEECCIVLRYKDEIVEIVKRLMRWDYTKLETSNREYKLAYINEKKPINIVSLLSIESKI